MPNQSLAQDGRRTVSLALKELYGPVFVSLLGVVGERLNK
jgi:hypothetical protein